MEFSGVTQGSTAQGFRTRGLKTRGFTLVELLIMVILVGILAAFAVPSFNQLINNNRTLGVSNEVAAMLQYARTHAVEHRAAIWVCSDNDAGTVAVRTACGAGGDTLRTMTATRGIDLTASATSLQFRSNGSAVMSGTNTSASFTVCHDGETANGFTVAVMATGNVRTYARGKKDTTNAITEC